MIRLLTALPQMMAPIIALLMALAARPGSAQEATARFGTGDTPLRVMSTTDIAVIHPALEAFAAANPDLRVLYEQWGSNALYARSGSACAEDKPAADVLFSSAAHQMVELVNRACAAPYRSALTDALPAPRRWRNELWGITEEPAVMIYNRDLLDADSVPRSRFELLDLMRENRTSLTGRIATYDIQASGLGYLFAYSDSLEASTFGALLEGFARTEAVATCCSAEIIEGVAKGRYTLAYNVLGSYVQARAQDRVGVILPDDYTVFLSRAFMIPRHAANPDGAQRLLDFLLSPPGQAILADAGLIFPDGSDESGLHPGARRFIGLTPSLLVALDRIKADRFIKLWTKSLAPGQ